MTFEEENKKRLTRCSLVVFHHMVDTVPNIFARHSFVCIVSFFVELFDFLLIAVHDAAVGT